MENDFWINVWAKLRQDEVVCIPYDFIVHPDFTVFSHENEIKSSFKKINSLYKDIYGDIAEHPDEYGMPLHSKNQYRIYSQQWRDSGQAPYRPFMLLYNLFICGDIDGQSIKVPIDKFKNVNNVKRSQFLFKKLTDYGFVFEGLKNNRPVNNDIIVRYPDNPILLSVFKMVANKAYNINPPIGFLSCSNNYLCCNFRLLQSDINTIDWHEIDELADRIHTQAEKDFVYKMNGALESLGMYHMPYGGFECYGMAYYHSEKTMNSKGPYSFRMVSRTAEIENNIYETDKMRLMLRIRNVSNCLEYLKTCSDSVKELFRYSDPGCAYRPCKHGVSYNFEGNNHWRCGCCAPAFILKPNIIDIPHYIKLVELGEKK